jgi:hypothetical protein
MAKISSTKEFPLGKNGKLLFSDVSYLDTVSKYGF